MKLLSAVARRVRHRRELIVIIAVILCAFSARLVYLIQVSDAPYFDRPAGDSKVFYERAEEILGGDVVGGDVPFYSSPLYPYFIALIMWLGNVNFSVLGFVQIIVGTINCVLIYLLAKRIAQGRILPATIAGVMAAFYGLLIFFDVDMLMIFMTLAWINAALLLLMSFRRTEKNWMVFIAGVCIGCAALDRTNVLLFVPVVCWLLLGGFSFLKRKWLYKLPALFAAGVILVLAPMAVRNYLVGKDLVLVSSNAGVNMYIGNNPHGVGVFYLPPETGLSNYDLEGSSTRIAEQSVGHSLKPSQVSRYWAGRAVHFIMTSPGKACRLLWKKFLLFWNAYEVPNNLDYYFVKAEFAPVLRLFFVGFWLVAPLGLVAIVWRGVRGFSADEKLLVAFIITYMCSVVPFFVTERYRLPIVSCLIVFTAGLIVDCVHHIRRHRVRELLFVGCGLVGAFCFVNWHRIQFDYRRMYTTVGTRYLEKALDNPRASAVDIKEAIISLKWAVEVAPQDVYAHYQLGRAYATVGHYSGALAELEHVLRLDPHHAGAQHAAEITRAVYERHGDRVTLHALPLTLFEKAMANQTQGQHQTAERMYRDIIARDPHHFMAYDNLAKLLVDENRNNEAIQVYERGLKFMPDNMVLLRNCADLYRYTGKHEAAQALESRIRDLQQKK
jgi:tetratricopeptide (TPR) repeat protein